MDAPPEFLQSYREAAEKLIETKGVGEPIFSRGTYQVEVADNGKNEKGKKKQFPFLQLTDEGKVADAFCSCDESGEGHGCLHLAAAYLKIFDGTPLPLHLRFRRSFWNRLFQMASRRHGYDTACLTQVKEGHFEALSETGKKLFSIEGKSPSSKTKLKHFISERVAETEETSLKFSNLPQEELLRYREGKGSHQLLFELSFWSDLAKWLMSLEKGEYQISFSGEPIPSEVHLTFPHLAVRVYIAEANWPQLIPSLSTVRSPLIPFDAEAESIERIDYDERVQKLLIRHRSLPFQKEAGEGTLIGDWLFLPGRGFLRQRQGSLFEKNELSGAEIGQALSQSSELIEKYLPLSSDKHPCQYRLFFDEKGHLHIELYLFEPKDLQQEGAASFFPWVYLPKRGFLLLDEWLFEGTQKEIPKEEVADFVNRHRVWLHQFPGFQTHLGSIEAHLTYSIQEGGDLLFEAELSFPQEAEGMYHFDEWVYLKGQGFYMKKESQGRLPIHPGLRIAKTEVGPFIASHKEELEQVQHFFSPHPLIQKMGLMLRLTPEGCISIEPRIEYLPGIAEPQVHSYGDYFYVKGQGFFELPPAFRLPERYREATILPPAQEAPFLAYELEPLKPYLLEVDPHLVKPERLLLKLRSLARDRRRRKQEWIVELTYSSEIGTLDLFTLWDALQEKKHHLFSTAGLLYLKEPRFNWLRQLPKKRLDRKNRKVRLSTLEWLRLVAFEEVQEPKADSPEAIETRALLEELRKGETHRLLDTTRLKATLRPYQELGLHWLWFLYCHGLSGLLCDDMGLGKTHQTMALLAAIAHEDEERKNKYLVVCPTSVIYHWQELLRKFLPELRISTYYGLERSLDQFEEHYDLLLTSYGILRTGKEILRPFHFELAIFDEIQIAKNHTSQTHQALKAIRSEMRLGLTGTPIENRIRELKALIDLVLPSYMPPDPLFREHFVTPIEKFQDESKKELLGKLIKPFLLRRKKSEVLTDLPEKIEEISYCDLSDEQKLLYRETAQLAKETLYPELTDSSKPLPFVHVFSTLSRLKQICDHPSLIHGNPKEYIHHASGKWDLFVELLYEARDSGQKVVVFSQYLDMLTIIETYLKKKGIGYASIKGSTRDRSEQLRRFREDPQCEVFVASLLAAGVGIDLTVASIVIHYDRWWNPAKENQATDRVHRIGQNRGVQVFKLVTKNTIEEHIHEMIEKKKGLLEEIIGHEDQINYLSRDELLKVFEKMFQEVEGI